MVNSLPLSDRIIIEVGYPLIKTYGTEAISAVKNIWEQRIFGHSSKTTETLFSKSPGLKWTNFGLINLLVKYATQENPKPENKKGKTVNFFYIVADLKCMDRAFAEVQAAAAAGASAVTCLGLAPLETINLFIKKCNEIRIDSVLDMMNVEYPFEVLSHLRNLPKIVMLHRGADEGELNKEKEMPYQEIERIKSTYDNILIATAGGETIDEVTDGFFNGADIVVVWRMFNENPQKIASLANEFLREIK